VPSTGSDSAGSQVIFSAVGNSAAISTTPSLANRTPAALSVWGGATSVMDSSLTPMNASDEFFALVQADRPSAPPRLLRRALSEDDWLQPLF
jgi:hypothetical protein